MWPIEFLFDLSNDLVVPTKAIKIFKKYVKEFMVTQWKSKLENIQGLLNLRNFIEDTCENLNKEYKQQICSEDQQDDDSINLTILNLMNKCKSLTDQQRKQECIEFLVEFLLRITFSNLDAVESNIVNLLKLNKSFCEFYVDCELDEYFALAKSITSFRPLLPTDLQCLEQIVKEMNFFKRPTKDQFLGWSKALNNGQSSLWPILALYRSNERGEAEDTFLHVPMPRIFGSPLSVHNTLLKNRKDFDFDTLALWSSRAPITTKNLFVTGNGHFAYYKNETWHTHELDTAYLSCALPGLSGHVWLVNPKTLQTAVYKIGSTLTKVLEFDLPVENEDHEPNWVDCQRDTEGSLVLSWSYFNPLTGTKTYEHMVALEIDTNVPTYEFLDTIAPLPNRRLLGTRIDWRDHGNLMSAYHTVTDLQQEPRLWQHNYDIAYDAFVTMNLSTQTRPIVSLYGSPFDIFLLSPLSSKAIQHYTLDRESKTYCLKNYYALPKDYAYIAEHFGIYF